MRLNCIRCGKESSLVLQDAQACETTPIDLCKDCMSYGEFKPVTTQIILEEVLNEG